MFDSEMMNLSIFIEGKTVAELEGVPSAKGFSIVKAFSREYGDCSSFAILQDSTSYGWVESGQEIRISMTETYDSVTPDNLVDMVRRSILSGEL